MGLGAKGPRHKASDPLVGADLTGAALDELRGNDVDALTVADGCERELGGQRADATRVLSDHRHARLQQISELEIVEADQRDGLGQPPTLQH